MTGRTARWFIAAALAIALSGCSSNGRGPEPASHKSELLGAGRVNGHPWRLTVFSSPEGNLCMAVNDQLDPSEHGDVFMEGGCGFGPTDDRMASPTDSAEAGNDQLLWGPAPQGAVRVRIDTYSIEAQPASDASAANVPGCRASNPAHLWAPIAHRLPAWTKPGGWFITHAALNGCGYMDAVFYDRNGHVIPEPRW
jgi:hypothetical protein